MRQQEAARAVLAAPPGLARTHQSTDNDRRYARPRPPDEEVVRARRIEILDDTDRVRIEIGQLALPGTHDIRGVGITLRGPNGSVRADLTEDASGARLAFLSSGNGVLELGATDANTLMLDRGGDDLI